LGCGAIAGDYGAIEGRAALGTIRAALDAGVTLLDVGDFYGMGRGELRIAEALRGSLREQVVISVKYGGLRDPQGRWLGHDLSPRATKAAIGYTLTRLGTDYVDIYRPARIEPGVPVEDTVGAIGELVDAGYVRHVGLSEVGPETIRRAHAVRPIADVQMEYSLLSRGIEDAILPTCRALGISVTAYGVLSRGLLSGSWNLDRLFDRRDNRARAPRFQRENLERNLALVEQLRDVGGAHDASPAQLAVAWVASRGQDIVPLVGARRPEQLHEALAALELELGESELAAIERAAPADAVAGERYPQAVLAGLDSERIGAG
jgi:aryl-alcohol dehydrogenase-like predicted oxidoreductase